MGVKSGLGQNFGLLAKAADPVAMVAARRPAAMVVRKDTLEISYKPGKLGEATDYLAINNNIGNRGPGVNLSINFCELDALVVQELLGFNTPGAGG